MFNENVKVHQEALEKAGHLHKLKFKQQDLSQLNREKKKTRQKRLFYFNPPYEMKVKTKITKKFFSILEKNIPPGHKLRPLLNRHTVKLSHTGCLKKNARLCLKGHRGSQN